MLEAIRRFVGERLAGGGPAAATSAATAGAGAGAPNRSSSPPARCCSSWPTPTASSPPRSGSTSSARCVRHFGLDAAAGAELLRLAETARSESLDHFQFTRLIAAEYDLGQKMVLAEVMWGVILADGRLTDHETHLVRKMASLMQLEPAYLAQARRAAAGETAR